MIRTILDEIGNTTKRTTKLAILERNKDNDTLKKVIHLALNPFINFYIKKIPEFTRTDTILTLEQALTELSVLSDRIKTGNAAILHLTYILSSLTDDDANVIIRIIRKDLRAGIQDATVNKIWKDLVPKYPCLLAEPATENLLSKCKLPYYSQIKSDGTRINIHVSKSGIVSFYGRSGKSYDFKDILDDAFVSLIKYFDEDMVFDGELIVVDSNDNILPRRTGNGIISKAQSDTITDNEIKNVRAILWDCIPLRCFNEHKCTTPYSSRFNSLSNAIHKLQVDDDYIESKIYNTILGNTGQIRLAETRLLYSKEEVKIFFDEAISRNEEGIMVKCPDSIWENKRSKLVLKYKSEKVCELIVTGFNYGTVGTKTEHKVGSLICESSDGKVIVNISGLTDSERDDATANFENKWKHSIVSVMYNERIKSVDRMDIDSLFLPRFLEIRTDKSEADSSKDIK
ncbi:ATP-dependent DNA ligase [Pseudomonas phage Paride]|nr:ATP-dependent DNA ligase [Pseudomonas phage Paride]